MVYIHNILMHYIWSVILALWLRALVWETDLIQTHHSYIREIGPVIQPG